MRLASWQRLRLGRVIVVLVLTVVLLQLIHMALLSRLEAREVSQRAGVGGGGGMAGPGVGRQLQGRSVKAVIEDMHERVKNAYRLDKSGTYHVLDNFLTSEHVVLQNAHDVTLVTQCSSHHLPHLVELSARWKGPVSVAVFTNDEDFPAAVTSILHHHFCYDDVYKYVTFHLAFPISRLPRDLDGLARAVESRSLCTASNATLSFAQPSRQRNYATEGLEYPHNLLRNLAINYVQTRYVLVVDVDMLPSHDLRAGFQKLQDREEMENKTRSAAGRTAYVVPSFEIQDGAALPPSKGALLQEWSAGAVRPFYQEVCGKCQRPTDYERWRDLGESAGFRVGYTVEWTDPWEPFYIARASLPLYDERFKQYGFNRISQVMYPT
ncbi:beta-1,4-glucuronyltransferase 1-like isoform X2 [Pomacea canaliculata]|uniref:beta-1,4-glucuronyltransferase 1-like isoform X2 n=1 Tax=Pomacea canaliculata TaxID=400727 RepID=UPI000D7272BC|nr:beta-1,4-glucuronyltransferase 1-like isoform X2 [Pomacea canaliculata]